LIVVPALALLIGANVASAQGTPKQGKPGSGKPAPGKAEGSDKQADKAKAGGEKVVVPFFGNSNCPCGKPADHDKFVEAEGQKIYVCSDACGAALSKDTKGAIAKAYPNAVAVTSKGCATCGKAVEAGKAKEATFQGHKVQLCCDNCVGDFKKDPALFIVKATWPDAKDAKNATDPIDGKPVAAGVVAILKNHIIHFSTAKNVAAFEKDPNPSMTKLKLD
jgi:YHS domain-containing protein